MDKAEAEAHDNMKFSLLMNAHAFELNVVNAEIAAGNLRDPHRREMMTDPERVIKRASLYYAFMVIGRKTESASVVHLTEVAAPDRAG